MLLALFLLLQLLLLFLLLQLLLLFLLLLPYYPDILSLPIPEVIYCHYSGDMVRQSPSLHLRFILCLL